MARYENHAPVGAQVATQYIHGNAIFLGTGDSYKRSRFDHNNILASLVFPQMFDRRSNVESAHSQTCQWIFDLDEYRKWNAEPRGLLWIKGKPGSGKSTLMSHVHRALWSERRIGYDINLEFFFSARGALLQNTPTGMLRSLLNQIFRQDPGCRQFLRIAYQEKRASFGSSNPIWERQLHELERLFIDTISTCASQHQITMLIDALDEAGGEAAEVASYLHTVNDRINELAGMAKICISCRHYPVSSNFRAVAIHVERHNHNDINRYIEDILDIRNMPNGTTQQDQIDMVSTLVNRADGIFQWAHLVTPMVIQWLHEGDTIKQIRTNLSEVPDGLAAVYEHILAGIIESRHSKKTLRLFQWVCLAQRPLSITELRYALSAEDINADATVARCHEAPDFEGSDQKMILRVGTWSGGLLEVVSSTYENTHWSFGPESEVFHDKTVVQVIHQSVRDFLLARGLPLLLTRSGSGNHSNFIAALPIDPRVALKLSHRILYLSCLNYLCTKRPENFLSALATNFRRPSANSEEYVKLSFPCLEYSSSTGLFHAEQSSDCRFQTLEDESKRLNESIAMWKFASHIFVLVDHHSYGARIACTGTTVLHLAATANLMSLVEYRIRCKDDVNATDEYGWTPTHMAAVRGHLAIVRALNRAGANIHSKTRSRHLPLFLAAGRGHVEVFKYLSESSHMLGTSKMGLQESLYAAAEAGHTTICELCIRSDADINAQGGLYGTALGAAARYGNEGVVRLLLKADAEVNAPGGICGTALQAAALFRHQEVVRLLLKAGAHGDARDEREGSASVAARVEGNKETRGMGDVGRAGRGVRFRSG